MQIPFNPADSDLIDDFEIFLRYLSSKPNMPLTTTGELKAADLWAMNERVTYRAPNYITTRSRMGDYPLLSFLFEVVLASRLFVVKFEKGNALAAVADRLDMYLNMTMPEKYVFLLETAWCYVDWSALDNDGRSTWFQGGIEELLNYPVGMPLSLTSKYGSGKSEPGQIRVSHTANAYLRVGYWFGWHDVREISQAKRNKFELQIDEVTLTEWGQQCLTMLLRERPFVKWNKSIGTDYSWFDDNDTDETEEDEERISLNTFAEPLRTLLGEPDLLSLYPINKNPPTGVFWLRAELPEHKASRTIAMPADASLEDFHLMIQEAFAFDNDHLYSFQMSLRNPRNGEQYIDPRIEEGYGDGYLADQTTLAGMNLYEGQQFLYIFDFGDRWEFRITVVRHLPHDQTDEASIVEQVGKAPEQYQW
jgi:hypothetical protein